MDSVRRAAVDVWAAIDWFDRAYVVDWSITWLLYFGARAVEHADVFERVIVPDDLSIAFPHTHQRVNGTLSAWLSFYMPLIIAGVNGALSRSTLEAHHGMLAFLSGRFLMEFVTECIKNRVGRLRPDFLERCKWDKHEKECTGKSGTILDGRRSFPSGHTSSAFVGMGFLFLLFSLKLGTFNLSRPASRGLFGSRMLRLVITLAPLGLATWIAISRLEDYRHHVEDVLAGGMIGSLSILFTFHVYWPSPFFSKNYQIGIAARPKLVYREASQTDESREGFELARLNDELDAAEDSV